jgi:D-3-phosphoglycerate dehydrogenase / 2-oxoglutarate reductase
MVVSLRRVVAAVWSALVSAQNMKKILVIQPLRPEALRLFEERPDVHVDMLSDYSPINLLRHIGDADALTIRDAPLGIDVLQRATRLKVISRHGVGFDNIPVEYCTSRGIAVTVVGDVNAVSVAEHTLCLLLAAARRGTQMDEAVRRGEFAAARARFIGVELRGRVLLIVGLGRIGREVAVRARAFDMKVIAFDPNVDRSAHPDTTFVDDLHEGLRTAQVVSLHVPLTPGTRHLIGRRELQRLPPGAIVINTARGGLIDEAALLDAIAGGHVRAAGLDTFATEPLVSGDPLLAEPRIVLSPHSAALTEECLIAMGLMTVRNALAGLDGALDPALVVNRSVLPEGPHALQ